MRKYYVYEHREADTGRTFYVGKGFNNRVGRKCDRSEYWHRVANKHGFTKHIIYEGLSEAESLKLEIDLIAAYGRENLCNHTDGGEGVSNPPLTARIGQGLGQASKDVYKFYHDEYGEFEGTCFELRLKFGLSKSQAHNIRAMARENRYRQICGWRLTPVLMDVKPAYKPPIRDKNTYSFYNPDYGVAIGQRSVIAEMCGINTSQVSHLITKRIPKCKGWVVLWENNGQN